MEIEITIDEEHGIAEVRLPPEVSPGEHRRIRERLLEICRDRKLRKILVDARGLRGAPPATIELFDFAASWAGLSRDVLPLVAGVAPQDAEARRWWKFGETVAANRGFETRIFDAVDPARAWLREAG